MASPLDSYIESLASGGTTADAAPAQSPGAFSRMAARVPAAARGFGARLVRGGLAVAPVAGAVSAALDPQENMSRVAADSGLDYNSFGGRIGANALNWLSKTGDVATFGGASALGGGIARLLGGQPFFAPYMSSTHAPVTVDNATGAVVPGTTEGYDALMTAPPRFSASGGAAAFAALPPAPFTAADIEGTRVPASGFGAFRRTTPGNEGDVVNLGSPVPMGPSAIPGRYVPKTFAGQAVQAGGDLALMGNQARYNALYAKLMMDYQSRIDAAAARGVEAAKINAGNPQFSVPLSAMPDKTGALPVIQNRGFGAGTMRMVTPTRPFTKEDLAANMKSSGRTREEVLRDARARGYEPEAGL